MAIQKISLSTYPTDRHDIRAGNSVEFTFDISSASFSRSQNSLVIAKGDSQVILDGFFITDDGKLPEIQLMDGTAVSAESFLQAMNPDMDLTTAMGPASRSLSSGGSEYADEAGYLVDSLDRLGTGNGLEQWDRANTGVTGEFSMPPMFTSPGMGVWGVSGAPVNPVTPPQPDISGGHDTIHVIHQDPVVFYWDGVPLGLDYAPGDNTYTATVITGKGMGVTGGSSVGSEPARLAGGNDVLIQVGMPSFDNSLLDGDAAVYLAGSYAGQGARAGIQGTAVGIHAAAGGFTRGTDATVATTAGLWADGSGIDYALSREENPFYSFPVYDDNSNSQLGVTAEAGDVRVKVSIVGNADEQGYEKSTYLGIAASDRGQTSVTAEDGSVSVDVTSDAAGESLSIAGIYGLFAGYGASAGDLLSAADLGLDLLEQTDANSVVGAYRYYMESLEAQRNMDDIYGATTKVTVNSHDNVNITVALGSQDVAGDVSGIKNVLGDIDVQSQTGDINVNVLHTGAYLSDNIYDGVSAISKSFGRVDLQAYQGDIHLNVQSSGNNVSIVRFTPTSSVSYTGGMHITALSGENVYLTGTVGEHGDNVKNTIAGIDAFDSNIKSENILLTASGTMDETGVQPGQAQIDVEALHHAGGETHSVGIGMSWVEPVYHRHASSSDLGIYVDAAELEVAARVTGDISDGDSYATGIFLSRGRITLSRLTDVPDEGDYAFYPTDDNSMENMILDVEGARHNKGIEVLAEHREDIYAHPSVTIRAEKLAISVSGGTTEGDSSSYGIYANGGRTGSSHVEIYTNTLAVEVANPQQSAGIVADSRSFIEIFQSSECNNGITVSVSCTIGDGMDITRGIALEAVNGGHLTVHGSTHSDSFIFNGDIIADEVQVPESYDGYQYSPDKSAIFLDTGNGNDTIHVNGDIQAKNGGTVLFDTGGGDDIIHLNGMITGSDVSIRAGEGNDLLVLQAPDADTFTAWYQEWFVNTIDHLLVENVYIKGVGDSSSIQWLTDMMESLDINWALEGSTWAVNDLSTFVDVDGLISSYLAEIDASDSARPFAEGLFASEADILAATLANTALLNQEAPFYQYTPAVSAYAEAADTTSTSLSEQAEMQSYINTLLNS